MADKGKLTQINEALDWIARTNQTLEQVQGDTLMTMQYDMSAYGSNLWINWLRC